MKALCAMLVLWSSQVLGDVVILCDKIDTGVVVDEMQVEVDGVLVEDAPGLVDHGGNVYSCNIPVLDYLGVGERKVFKIRWCTAADPNNAEPCSDWGSWTAEHGGGKSVELHRSPPFALGGLRIR